MRKTLQQRLHVCVVLGICCVAAVFFILPSQGRVFAFHANKHQAEEEVEMIDLSTNGEVNVSESSMISIDTAHREGLPHRGVWMYVVRRSTVLPDRYEALMVRRSSKAKTCPGAWSLPGEHTKFKESYRAAALRGIWEEFGVDANAIQCAAPLGSEGGKYLSRPVLYNIEYPGPSHRVDVQWVIPYLLVVKENVSVKLESEASVMKWVLIEEVQEWAERCNSNSHSHNNKRKSISSASGRKEKETAKTGSSSDGIPVCQSCEVKSFLVHKPELNTTLESSFLALIANMTKDVRQFMDDQSRSNNCSKSII